MSLISILIATYTTSKTLFQHKNPAIKVRVDDDAEFITSKAKNLRSKVGQRDKLNCDYGIWYLSRGPDDLLYAACVQKDYPERVAFALIAKLQKELEGKQPSMAVDKYISKKQKQLKALAEQYKSSRVDKVKEAQFVVGELKDELYKGVNKVIKNQDELESMKVRTENMKGKQMIIKVLRWILRRMHRIWNQ